MNHEYVDANTDNTPIGTLFKQSKFWEWKSRLSETHFLQFSVLI